ncbi:hypothetical protein Hanom_Chr03g00193571 [Helianthus anomalus]
MFKIKKQVQTEREQLCFRRWKHQQFTTVFFVTGWFSTVLTEEEVGFRLLLAVAPVGFGRRQGRLDFL